uniref:beta-ketoacyl reductase n=1 Tax=Actinomadura roseirufa TaxID=2094049 RepID=UPI001041276C
LVRAPAGGAPAGSWTPGGTVLITGGTGAVGLEIARALARDGAVHLVLAGRRGADVPGLAEATAGLAALGAKVTVAACDVSSREEVAALIESVERAGPPISAVVHGAGLLQNRDLVDLGAADVVDVALGKVAGAVHLADLLADRPLEAFVLASSTAGVWGSVGQAVYAAANAFLDAFAAELRGRGVPATSVAWGPWAGEGMAAGDEAREHLRRRGLPPMEPGRAVAELRRALDLGETAVTVVDVDWDRFAPAFTAHSPSGLIGDLPDTRRALARRGGPGGAEPDAAGRLAALPGAERRRFVLGLVLAELAAVLGRDDPDAIGPTADMRELGLESMTVLELRNRLERATGLPLPATLVHDSGTPEALAGAVLDARDD